MSDQSLMQSLRKAIKDGTLSYLDIGDIIRSTFDSGFITSEESNDLHSILSHGQRLMDERTINALRRFLEHLDRQPKFGGCIRVPNIDPGSFSARNTDLGKFSHGCFDVNYLPKSGTVFVSLRVEYRFENKIQAAQQSTFKKKLKDAVRAWSNSGVYLKTSDLSFHPVIDLRFELYESPNCHFPVDVEIEERREWVGSDLNVHINTTTQTLIHELGHVFGNYDEYFDSGFVSWLERRAWWHDNDYESDKKALMHSGTEFRARYFDHFASWVNQRFKPFGIRYEAIRKIS